MHCQLLLFYCFSLFAWKWFTRAGHRLPDLSIGCFCDGKISFDPFWNIVVNHIDILKAHDFNRSFETNWKNMFSDIKKKQKLGAKDMFSMHHLQTKNYFLFVWNTNLKHRYYAWRCDLSQPVCTSTTLQNCYWDGSYR